jgi:hypothetical protein
MAYQVLIDDNFHYQDESERVKHGVFATPEEANRRLPIDRGRLFDRRHQARHVGRRAL